MHSHTQLHKTHTHKHERYTITRQFDAQSPDEAFFFAMRPEHDEQSARNTSR